MLSPLPCTPRGKQRAHPGRGAAAQPKPHRPPPPRFQGLPAAAWEGPARLPPGSPGTHLEDGAHGVLTTSRRLIAPVGECSPTGGAWNKKALMNSSMCAQRAQHRAQTPGTTSPCAGAHDLGRGTAVDWGSLEEGEEPLEETSPGRRAGAIVLTVKLAGMTRGRLTKPL